MAEMDIVKKMNPHHTRKLELANDVEVNPGPRRSEERQMKTKAKMRRSKSSAADSGISSDSSIPVEVEEKERNEVNHEPSADDEKIAQLEVDIQSLQNQLSGVDMNVERLLASIETLRPIYNEAKSALSRNISKSNCN